VFPETGFGFATGKGAEKLITCLLGGLIHHVVK